MTASRSSRKASRGLYREERIDDVGCEVISNDDAREDDRIGELLGDDYENEEELSSAFDAFVLAAAQEILTGAPGVIDVPVRAYYATNPDIVAEWSG